MAGALLDSFKLLERWILDGVRWVWRRRGLVRVLKDFLFWIWVL
jgi:hypothetical protein